MYCSSCGVEIVQSAAFCPSCGARVGAVHTDAQCAPPRERPFFSFDGRSTRGEYWLVTLLTTLPVALLSILFFVLVFSADISEDSRIITVIASLCVLWFLVWIITLPVNVRRLHDLDGSGWLVIVFIVGGCIPYLNVLIGFWQFVALGCCRGTRGPNDYGPDPLEKRDGGVVSRTSCGVVAYAEQTSMSVCDEVKDLQNAAEQGDAKAQCFLGGRYYRGEGVNMDKAEAVKWYRKAAEQGNAEAQCKLGSFYEFGYHVAEDRAEAAKWYRMAAEQGDEVAKARLEKCGMICDAFVDPKTGIALAGEALANPYTPRVRCGAGLKDGDMFCMMCGTRIN